MKRSKARLEQDRGDLLAALQDAERPIKAPELVATAYGYTLDSIPDMVLHVAMHRASTDLRALHRKGQLVLSTPGFVATYTQVDLPGSDLATRAAERREADEDYRDLMAQVDSWELAE